ncbi:hypothetical protein KCP74_01910 [Salmonella enterica subsp. enterica]|nr:hypothetical protein KCP74_01910 [Salmonella enterica subsp. enterica]
MLAEKILSGSTQEEITEKYTAIAEFGKSAASGSVMKIAQCASRYQYDPELPRECTYMNTAGASDNIIDTAIRLCYHVSCCLKEGA